MPCWGKKESKELPRGPGDVTHERALSPADLFGGKAPVGTSIRPSGANLLAHMQLKCILHVPL